MSTEIAFLKAQKGHWEKRMLDGTLSASEVIAYLKLRHEVAMLEAQSVSDTRPKANLPSFAEDEFDNPIKFKRG